MYRARWPWHHWLPTAAHEFVKKLRQGEIGTPHPSTVVRRECLEAAQAFSDNLKVAGDYSMALAIAESFGPPAILSNALSIHVPNGLTSQHKSRHAFEKSLARVRRQGAVTWLKEPWRQIRRLFRVAISLPLISIRRRVDHELYYPVVDNEHLPLKFYHPTWPVPRSALDLDEKIYIPVLRRAPGGVETWIRDFREFSKKETQVVPREAEQNSAVLSHLGEHQKDIRAWRYGKAFIPSPFLIFRDLRKIREKNPLIHAHNLQVALLCRLFRPDSRLVYFSHNNFGRQLSALLPTKRWLYFPVESIVLRSSQAVFSFSEEDARRMRRVRPLVFELQGSFNDRYFPITERREPTGDDVVWVGRFSPVKNPLLALQAFRQFAATEKGRLIMIGDGPLRKKLEHYVMRSGLDERVTFTGPLPPKKVREIMFQSRILLVTSKSEGPTPRTIFEGLATGINIVSTDRGDPGETLKRLGGGVTVSSHTPESICDGIFQAIENVDRQKRKLPEESVGSHFFQQLFR